MRAAWITDPHLNFLTVDQIKEFASYVDATDSDVAIITGDIAESQCLVSVLTIFAEVCLKPIYFVLGNHDFWHSNMASVVAMVNSLTHSVENLHYIGDGKVISLGSTALIGVDGWYDGRAGVGMQNTEMRLWDTTYIADLRLASQFDLADKVLEIAREQAATADINILRAMNRDPERLLLATHVPPFRAASYHGDEIGDNVAAPHFVNVTLGETLSRIMKDDLPNMEMLVICGHTHSPCTYHHFDNLVVKAGRAEYGTPTVAEILEV